ncbi:MAG TPA: Pvc16 family protein [Terracidiphilus sp.]|nr:Pvc16 family protein [Terracidiphilus sp.]
MAPTVQDLGQVTHLLISNLKQAIENSPRYLSNHFPFEVTGLMPDVSRKDGTSILNLNLLHVGRDPYYRNTPIQTVRAQLNVSQPLSLNLSYLLTSYSEKNWHMEQYLMSVALQYFHSYPIYVGTNFEFTITVQADSIEEMSRLWQAITVPIRLSTLFRVAIVFLEPAQPPVGDSRSPVEVTVSVGPDLGFADPVPEPEPQLYELAIEEAFIVAPNVTDVGDVLVATAQPCVIAGQTVRLRGSGLDQADASGVFLSPKVGASEWPLPAAWVVTNPALSGAVNGADEIAVLLGGTPPPGQIVQYGATPATNTVLSDVPLPGAYLIKVGNAGGPYRSNELAVLIGPEALGVTAATTLLAPDVTNTYTFQANGLIAGQTQVLLNTTALTVAATVGPGVATVTVQSGTTPGSISFQLPSSGLTSKAYMQVRLIVNSVEAPPAWWIQVP